MSIKIKVNEARPMYEMSNKRKFQTGLPVNIWIDEGGWYAGHAKRIKFQLNHADRMANQPSASMTLDGELVLDTYDKSVSELSKADIRAVSNFVKNNAFALDKIADEEIYMDTFDEFMIRGGEPASAEQIAFARSEIEKRIRK